MMVLQAYFLNRVEGQLYVKGSMNQASEMSIEFEVANAGYLQVETSRIEAICKAKVRLNADTVLDPEAPQALAHVVRQLQRAQVSPDTKASIPAEKHTWSMPWAREFLLRFACRLRSEV